MEAKELIDFLGKAEKLKSVPRHCVTSDGVVENVAAHSWRLALMAFLLKDELGEINIDRVIRMCLVHDLGEAVTGDIPTFEKTGEHEEIEKLAVTDCSGSCRSLCIRSCMQCLKKWKRCRQRRPGSIRR